MSDKYQPLRDAIAAGTTPGPWTLKRHTCRCDGRPDQYDDWTIYGRDGEPICVEGSNPCVNDPDYIAAANPDTIAALLAERDALRKALQWYASMSKRMGNASIAGDSQAILALMKDVAVDYGGRARAALADGEASNG